nr:cell division control protein 3 [Quercus suber]
MESPDPSTLVPFLRLPRKIRTQIYAAARILGTGHYPRWINISHERVDSDRHAQLPDRFGATHSLLLTCRMIYEEVSTHVYSNVHYTVLVYYDDTLKFLRQLRPSSLRALRSLAVCLNMTSCGFMPECLRESLLEEWNSLWRAYVQPNITKDRLVLAFVCDVADFATGCAAVAAISDPTQRTLLAGCTVRLARGPESKLRALAESTVQAVTTQEWEMASIPTPGGVGFMDLPTEVRLHILTFTDLVAPEVQIEWNPQHGFYSRYQDPPSTNLSATDGICRPYLCCRKLAHATYSRQPRTCWRSPRPLFLVCQQIHQEAIAVFFAHNKFTIVPYVDTRKPATSDHKLAPAIFFKDAVPRSGLKYLNHVELVMPRLGETWTYFHRDEYVDWLRTLRMISVYLNPSSLRIYVCFTGFIWDKSVFWPSSRHRNKPPGATMAMRTYQRFVATFKILAQLRDFSVVCCDSAERKRTDQDQVKPTGREIELQRLVMGPHYDSSPATRSSMVRNEWFIQHKVLMNQRYPEKAYTILLRPSTAPAPWLSRDGVSGLLSNTMSISPKPQTARSSTTSHTSKLSLSTTAVTAGEPFVSGTTDSTTLVANPRLSVATANGSVNTAPPARASPIPTQANVPNGKPTSPLVATSNAMTSGGTQGPQTVSSKDPKAAAQAASDMRNIVRRKLTGYVGFANLPNQWHRKSVRKGFNFNVMVVGESGLGKSTLVNTLFNTSLYPPKERKQPSLDFAPKTVSIQSISADIEENGVRLRLTVVDTPGFGDFVNNDDSWRPIVENIEQRFDAYLDAENKVNRMNIVDNRVHACVYFVQPTGHSLKPLDVEVMRRLHTKVNLIPVIAKADTLTDEEIAAFKQRILADIHHHNIHIFEGPRYELDDEETIAENNEIMSKVPFAVVGANTEVQTPEGRKVRGRRYPWGVIEVDNEEHCDFVKLRQMLIRTHMEELKEHTNNFLYENYRSDKLTAMGVAQDPSVFKEVNPAVKQEEERSLHEQKLAKMELEMKMVFQQKVQEKESKLKQSEEELYARHREMKEQLDRQRQELEEKKSRIESGRPIEEKGRKKGGFSLRG